MQITAYIVAAFDDNDKVINFFNGQQFSADPKTAKIFQESQKDFALYQLGSEQKLSANEIRLVKLKIEAPFELAESEPAVPLPPVPIATPTTAPSDTVSKTTIPELSVLAT